MAPYRIIYWQIGSTAHWIFYALAGISVAFFLAGMAAYIRVWKKKAASVEVSFSWDALKRVMLDSFLGLRLFRGDIAAGTMHLLIFWVSRPAGHCELWNAGFSVSKNSLLVRSVVTGVGRNGAFSKATRRQL